MPVDTLEFLLTLSAWLVVFLLGGELHTGFEQWRLKIAAEQPSVRRR